MSFDFPEERRLLRTTARDRLEDPTLLGPTGGTGEIMCNVIAERVLGLPAEPRVDKNQPFAAMRRNRD